MEEIDQVPTQLLAELRAVLEFLEAKAVIQHIKQKLVGFRERYISTFGTPLPSDTHWPHGRP